jgi:hypothetical protein
VTWNAPGEWGSTHTLSPPFVWGRGDVGDPLKEQDEALARQAIEAAGLAAS